MATIIKQRSSREVVYYRREFDDLNVKGAGWSFSVDEHGNLQEALKPEAWRNWIGCTSGTYNVRDCGIVRHQRTVHEPAELSCDCGQTIVLDSSWYNACGRCGRGYNGAGQMLAGMDQWGEETGESLTDMWPADGGYDG